MAMMSMRDGDGRRWMNTAPEKGKPVKPGSTRRRVPQPADSASAACLMAASKTRCRFSAFCDCRHFHQSLACVAFGFVFRVRCRRYCRRQTWKARGGQCLRCEEGATSTLALASRSLLLCVLCRRFPKRAKSKQKQTFLRQRFANAARLGVCREKQHGQTRARFASTLKVAPPAHSSAPAPNPHQTSNDPVCDTFPHARPHPKVSSTFPESVSCPLRRSPSSPLPCARCRRLGPRISASFQAPLPPAPAPFSPPAPLPMARTFHFRS
jgi:hypothetical protein